MDENGNIIENGTPSFSIPDEYKDRGWATQIHSIDDLCRKVDNQEKYISKGQLPHKDSSAEDITNFTEKMKKYTAEQDYSELVGQDEELGKALRESGVPKFQAKAVVDLIKGREAKNYSEEEFGKLLNEKFKGRESDLDKAKAVLKEMGEEKTTAFLSKRNDVVADMMDILAEVGKKYDVKTATAMAHISDSPLGSQPSNVLDWKKLETRQAFAKELDEWRSRSDRTEEEYHAIMKKYGRID